MGNNNKNKCLTINNSELKLTTNTNFCTKWSYLGFNNLQIKNSNKCLSFQFTRDHGISLKIVDNCEENKDDQRFAYNFEKSTEFDYCLRKSLLDEETVVVGFCNVLNSGLEEYLKFGVRNDEE